MEEQIQVEKKSKAWIWILVVVLIVLGVGAYLVLTSGSDGGLIPSLGGNSIPQPPALPS